MVCWAWFLFVIVVFSSLFLFFPVISVILDLPGFRCGCCAPRAHKHDNFSPRYWVVVAIVANFSHAHAHTHIHTGLGVGGVRGLVISRSRFSGRDLNLAYSRVHSLDRSRAPGLVYLVLAAWLVLVSRAPGLVYSHSRAHGLVGSRFSCSRFGLFSWSRPAWFVLVIPAFVFVLVRAIGSFS